MCGSNLNLGRDSESDTIPNFYSILAQEVADDASDPSAINVTRKNPEKWTIEGHISPNATPTNTATANHDDTANLSESDFSFDATTQPPTTPTTTKQHVPPQQTTTQFISAQQDTPHRNLSGGLHTTPVVSRGGSSSSARAELGSEPPPPASSREFPMRASSPVAAASNGPVHELVRA